MFKEFKWNRLILIFRSYKNYFFLEDSKKVVWRLFFLFCVFSKVIILSLENLKFLVLFLHFKTFFCLPLIFLFNASWGYLVNYFVFQSLGRILVEFGYVVNYCFSDYFVLFGLFLKLGIFPFLWWFPSFMQNNNWFNFFFFQTIKKFPIFILAGLHLHKEINAFFLVVLLSLAGVIFFLNLQGFTYYLGAEGFIKGVLAWRALVDTCFFCWVILIRKFNFIYLFFFYRFLYLIIRTCFSTSNTKKSLNSICFGRLSGIYFFFLGLILVFFLIGFPPLFPFLIKLELSFSYMVCFNSYLLVLCFFLVSLIQGIYYLRLFFFFLRFLKFSTIGKVTISLWFFLFFKTFFLFFLFV